ALPNGNYLVRSPGWDNGAVSDAGAVSFASGTSGASGPVSAANSLVGATANDQVGGGVITILANSNYLVHSPFWDNGAAVNAGAVTFGSGTSGISGAVSAANSQVGGSPNDFVGLIPATVLPGGKAQPGFNYLVVTPFWDNGAAADAGAVTFGSGTSGVSGTVSVAISLVGTSGHDSVGG